MVNIVHSSPTCTTCFEVPQVDSSLTTSVAIPFRQEPYSDEPQPDILCPLVFEGVNQCANLSTCDHFDDSVYAQSMSITVCRRENTSEMCLRNFGSHFTRLYIESKRIVIQSKLYYR